MNVKLLPEHYLEFLSLKAGCTGLFESTLVKMPHCWKSHVTAQLCLSRPMYISELGITPDSRLLKMLILWTNVHQKLLGTEFLIAICCQSGDKGKSKTLFLAIFDPCWSIVTSVFDCHLSGVGMIDI